MVLRIKFRDSGAQIQVLGLLGSTYGNLYTHEKELGTLLCGIFTFS